MEVRDRVREFRRVRAAELRPSPRQWKSHPEAQANALRGILAEVGFGQAVVAFENERGELELIDGHLRSSTTPEQEIPCLVLDVTREEAYKLLATMDPLVELAQAIPQKLEELLKEFSTDNVAVEGMLEGLKARHGIKPPHFEAAGLDAQGRLDQKQMTVCPKCGHEF